MDFGFFFGHCLTYEEEGAMFTWQDLSGNIVHYTREEDPKHSSATTELVVAGREGIRYEITLKEIFPENYRVM